MRGYALLAGLLLGAHVLPCQPPRQSYPRNARPPGQWSLGPRPLLEIGGDDASGPTEFAGIIGVVRQTDGTIVVADAASRELRIFDARGRFQRIAARRGRGPGEIPELDGLTSTGDTLIAIDGRRGVHVFAPNGDWRQSLVFPPVPGFIVNPAIGAFGGTLIAYRLRAGSLDSLRANRRDSIWFASINLRDTTTRVLGAQPLPPTWGLDPRFPGPYPLGFAFEILTTARDGRICAGYGADYDISCFDTSGQRLFSIHRDVPLRAVHDSARRAYRFVTSGRRPDGTSRFEGSLRAHRERVAEAARFTATFPTISQLLLSRTGELWVRRFVTEDGTTTARWRSNQVPSDWSIYDRQGRWIADCRMPARFAPGDIGADYVIGVSRDDDDVERVTLWPIRR